jgi:hypothetical protein
MQDIAFNGEFEVSRDTIKVGTNDTVIIGARLRMATQTDLDDMDPPIKRHIAAGH